MYGLHGDSCIHLHANGSMLGAWYWFHHIHLVAYPAVRLVAKLMSGLYPRRHRPLLKALGRTAVERAGKLGVVNQAHSIFETLSP